jgi:hypothetical protein
MENWMHRLIIITNPFENGDTHCLMLTSDNTQYALGTGTVAGLKERAWQTFGRPAIRWYKKEGMWQSKRFKF